jgi:hypothetical protein
MHWLWDFMEAPVTDVPSLRRRTTLLVAIHLTLAAVASAVLGLVVWRIRLLVTLAQRSNVETLVLAFVVAFALYLLVTTLPSTWGSLLLVVTRARGRERGQRWLQRRGERQRKATRRAYLNVIVEGPEGGTIDLPVEDEYGRVGGIRLDGGEIALVDMPSHIVSSPLALVASCLGRVGRLEGTDVGPLIVAWSDVDRQLAERYGSEVRAFKQLALALGKRLWPTVHLDRDAVEELRAVLRAAAAELREDLLLPDIEYSAEFTIPIIPEPLAFMQVRRTQDHADAVATMGCATLVLSAILAIVGWLIVWPPWVPSK